MTCKTNKFIAITILIGISLLDANAQEQTVAAINEGSITTEKIEKKRESTKKQSSSDDSWTGFYVGGFGGYTNGRASANTSTVFNSVGYFHPTSVTAVNNAGAKKIKSNGFNGGGTFGYNYQNRKFFVGGEVDFGSQRINQSVTSGIPYPVVPTTRFSLDQSITSDWMMTVRPRVGVAFKKALLYATGGVAVTNIKYSAKFTDTYASAIENGNFSKTKAGLTAGAGMEFKVASRWSVKGDGMMK
jgi:outer membrane immunogenic protein